MKFHLIKTTSKQGGQESMLKVTVDLFLQSLVDAEHVHWFFNNKKKIFDDAVRLSSDFTKSQRECYNIVNQERKERIKNDEKDLVIKTVNGFPTIVTIKKGTEKSNTSYQSKN